MRADTNSYLAMIGDEETNDHPIQHRDLVEGIETIRTARFDRGSREAFCKGARRALILWLACLADELMAFTGYGFERMALGGVLADHHDTRFVISCISLAFFIALLSSLDNRSVRLSLLG